MSINISNSGTFSPLEYTDNRLFLQDLQSWIEGNTKKIFEARCINEFGQEKWDKTYGGENSKKIVTNEPEDLYTLSLQDDKKYFDAIQKAALIWKSDFQKGMQLALEMGKGDPSEGMKIYFSAVARIYAQRSKVNNKASEEKLIEKILKELLKRMPYYRHAFNTLLGAQQGYKLSNIRSTVEKTVEKILWKDNTRGGVITVGFGKKDRGQIKSIDAGIDPIVEENKEDTEFQEKHAELLKIVENEMDANIYVEMLLEPINFHSTIKEQTLMKIRRNPGFLSLCEILKDLLNIYEKQPKTLLDIEKIVDFLRLLGNIEAVGKTASILDSYEKKANQYALVFLCQRLIKELTEFYAIKLAGKEISDEEAKDLLENLSKVSLTIDRLSGKVEMEENNEPQFIILEPNNLKSVVKPTGIQVILLTSGITEDEIRTQIIKGFESAEKGMTNGYRVAVTLDTNFSPKTREKVLSIIQEIRDSRGSSTDRAKTIVSGVANDDTEK